MRSKEQQLHLQLTSLAAHYVPPQQKRGGAVGSGSAVVGVPLPQHTTSQKDTHMTPSHDPEPHGSRDTFVPPPVKSDIELLREKLISMDAITEIDIGGCPPVKYVKYTDDQLPDPSLVVYDPNDDPVPHWTDEELTAALIKSKAEADAYDKNLAQEMKAALDSLTEEDMKPIDRPVPPIPSPEDKTIHYHNKKWWFWDETGQHRHGPYETHAECVKDLNHYCHVYLGHPEDPS